MSVKASEVHSALLSVLDSLGVRAQSCVYVSTPISTGIRYLQWLENSAAAPEPGSHEYEIARRQVKSANLDSARALITSARESFPMDLVIDPTALIDIRGWQQSDYHLYWMQVITRYVHTMIFSDGWQYSEGCAVEFAAAKSAGLNTVDARHQTIDLATGLGMVEVSIARYANVGSDSEVLDQVLRSLQDARDPVAGTAAACL
jgi:hypothetical protein